MKHRNAKAFVYVLGIVSALGFVAIAVKSLLGVDFNAWATSLIFGILGIGLIVQGNILQTKKMLKGGLTKQEISNISTSVLGLFSILTGFVTSPLIATESQVFLTIQGIVSIIAIIIILFQMVNIK
jgi:hypothetical protein